jgi:hypothetical protein
MDSAGALNAVDGRVRPSQSGCEFGSGLFWIGVNAVMLKRPNHAL